MRDWRESSRGSTKCAIAGTCEVQGEPNGPAFVKPEGEKAVGQEVWQNVLSSTPDGRYRGDGARPF